MKMQSRLSGHLDLSMGVKNQSSLTLHMDTAVSILSTVEA
jgi:hypothetical protein